MDTTASRSQEFGRPRSSAIYRLVLVLLLGFALRVAYLMVDRFHADEALYAGWALNILDGDSLLRGVPVDKPPLYLYTLAGSFAAFGRSELAARLPSLSASMLSIVLVYRLGRRLYGSIVGEWTALMLALSPFDILFARTAFTDSVLVAWMLAALCAAASSHWLWTGVFLGLAFATKQHAVLLVPLVLAAGIVQFVHVSQKARPLKSRLPSRHSERSAAESKGDRFWVRIILGFLLPFLGVLAWDATRWPSRPSYWHQSAMSYGGLIWAPAAKWGERLLDWIGWGRYLLGSWFLTLFVLLAVLFLLFFGWLRRPTLRETWLDTLWIVYLSAYIALHTVFQFSIWDRYLLPLAPLIALLVGRAITQSGFALESLAPRPFNWSLARLPGIARRLSLAWTCLIVSLALFSGIKAAQNGYPVGGDHWAYQGLDEIVAYLQHNAPPDAVLYHHWLRWHYSYYLYGTALELRWWESGDHMQREVLRTPERVQYVVLPDWRTLEPDAPQLDLQLVYQARRRDQSVSLSLYRVFPRPLGSWRQGT